MASRDGKIQPSEFEPRTGATERDGSTGAARAQRVPRWILVALVSLALLALAVIFLLPQHVSTPRPTAPAPVPDTGAKATPPPTDAAPAPPGVEVEASPWAEAQMAERRKAAQDILEQLLRVERELQDRNVNRWAAENMQQARERAAEGDGLYRSREFEAAGEAYADALQTMQALRDSVPQRLEEQQQRVERALEKGDLEPAREGLAMARALTPENPDLDQLAERVDKAPRLFELLEQARAAEADGDLALAERLLRQATALDPGHRLAAGEAARVAAALAALRFNTAMGEGYRALDDSRFDAAGAAFGRARQLRPDSAEVATAMRELESARTAARLAALREKGLAAEQDERWEAAVEAYQQALAIDDTLVFAREGLERARPRAQLEKSLQQTLEQPGRLTDPAVAEQAGTLLAEARQATPRGRRHAGAGRQGGGCHPLIRH